MNKTPSVSLGSTEVITLSALLREILAEEGGAYASVFAGPEFRSYDGPYDGRVAAGSPSRQRSRVHAGLACANNREPGQKSPRPALR